MVKHSNVASKQIKVNEETEKELKKIKTVSAANIKVIEVDKFGTKNDNKNDNQRQNI